MVAADLGLGRSDFAPDDASASDELLAYSVPAADGARTIEFVVPDVYCAACIVSIETALEKLPQVTSARVNLSKRRVRIGFRPGIGSPMELAAAITASGYRNHPLDPAANSARDVALAELVRSLAVAGFAAANIMLFSVSVWSGADLPTRNLFHWVSALIALPAIVYAGRPFYRSAFAALRVGRTNMDVPITIGISLATGLSLFETITSGEHAYFDASTMLLFFLLIGRTLDHLMRERARGALGNLERLTPLGATQVRSDGTLGFIAADRIAPGMRLLIRPGDRLPVDCRIVDGTGEVDASLVTGESLPVSVTPGTRLVAGIVNGAASLTVEALQPVAESFLARMVTLMADAEGARTGYRRLADRVAAIYAPVLHTTAAATFLGWGLITGNWHGALVNAVAVLIITCPCALALAVPMVQVVAAARLFRSGIMMRDGSALERAAKVDDVFFDKTGTLTLGQPSLTAQIFGDPELVPFAAAIAAHSSHPLARALAASVGDLRPVVGDVREIPGAGVEVREGGTVWRLGNARFCGAPDETSDTAGSRVYLSSGGEVRAAFAFEDAARPDAADAIADLQQRTIGLEILSGDTPGAVAAIAHDLAIPTFKARQSPQDKLDTITAATAAGECVLMVGDGINDAPALRAAAVSMAPSDATDIGRTAADFIFTNGRLTSVPFLLDIARRAEHLVVENLSLAVIYNAVALPLAIMGFVTPLIAALAMSGSSVLVVLNAMRLNLGPQLRPADGTARISS